MGECRCHTAVAAGKVTVRDLRESAIASPAVAASLLAHKQAAPISPTLGWVRRQFAEPLQDRPLSLGSACLGRRRGPFSNSMAIAVTRVGTSRPRSSETVQGRMKRLSKGCAKLLLFLALAEGTLRIAVAVLPPVRVALSPPVAPTNAPSHLRDAHLVGRPSPESPDHDFRGFRNEGVIRKAAVVAIGDSQTYGMGANLVETWPHQLELRSGMTVYNMAWGGWGPVEYAFLVEEARRLSPEIVVVGLYATDVCDAFLAVYLRGRRPEWRQPLAQDPLRGLVEEGFLRPQAERRASIPQVFPKARGSEPPDAAYRDPPFVPPEYGMPPPPRAGGHALRLLDAAACAEVWVRSRWRPYYRWRQRRSGAPGHRLIETGVPSFGEGTSRPVETARTVLLPAWTRWALQVDVRKPSVDFRSPIATEGFGITVAALEEMQRRLRPDGTRFLVLLIPTRELVLFPLLRDAQGAALDEAYAEYCRWEEAMRECLMAALAERGVEVSDALPALRACVDRNRIPFELARDGHPNVLGYGVIADAVFQAMESDAGPARRPVEWSETAKAWASDAEPNAMPAGGILEGWAELMEATPPVSPESIIPYGNALSTYRYRWLPAQQGKTPPGEGSVVVVQWSVRGHVQEPPPVLGRVRLRLEPMTRQPWLLTEPLVDGIVDLDAEMYVPVDLPAPP